MSSPPLRSPRDTLGGYVILPRLIDKVHLHARGELPREYQANLLKVGLALDGRFLAFTNLDGEQFRQVILSAGSDEAVLAWVEQHAHPHSMEERREWAAQLDAYRSTAEVAEYRRRVYPELAAKVDVKMLSVFDLIDMDEGKVPISDKK
jgi:hypothetical protein